jgi:GNAT superfamily N-acetyltransferase
VLLTAEVQREYQRRYGDAGDASPIDAAEFVTPHGLFVVVLDDGAPVGMGGWRRYDDGIGELKRMYVRESARGRGIARQLLAHLESTAAEAGIRRLVLETGVAQPEAIALYRSAGYVDVPSFGYYVDHDDSVHLGKTL